MSMCVTDKTTVRDLAGRHPTTLKVFEDYGIDYCCGGDRSLADAAQESGAELGVLVAALQSALQEAPGMAGRPAQDWFAASISDLISHILETHHAYMHSALPRVGGLLEKVIAAHGRRHGAVLSRVQDYFWALDEELTAHLAREEEVLFPYLTSADMHARGMGPMPVACFPTLSAPIRQMQREHEHAGEALRKIRDATSSYAVPQDACPSFVALYAELQGMEADLHQHIHLENNILFPRALAMEKVA